MVWIQVWILHVTTFLLINGDNDVPFLQQQRRKVRSHSISLTSHLASGKEYLDETSPLTSQMSRSISTKEDIRADPLPLHSSKVKSPLTFLSSKSSRSSSTIGPLLLSISKPSSEVHKESRETSRKRLTSLPRDRSLRGSSPQGVAGAGLLVDASALYPLLSSARGGHRAKRASYKSFKESRLRGRAEGMYSLQLPDDRTQTVSYYADENGYFPTITYKGGHQFSYYFAYPHEANKHPEHLQKGSDMYKSPRRLKQVKEPHHPTKAGDHYTSRVGRLGEVALNKPLTHPLRPSILKSQNIPGHSYTSLPVSKYQAPLAAKSQIAQHSSALLKSQDATRHSYKGDEVKSQFSVKRLPLVAEQKYISSGNSYQHSSDSSGYSDHYSMKNAPSYTQRTYVTAQPHVLPSQSYGPPPPKYNTESKVPVLGAAKPTAHELRKPTAHALSDHYGPPHQTGYSSKTISLKPFHHASTPAMKGSPHLAAHPARESTLKPLSRGLLVASRMLEDGEDLSVYIASLDSPDSGYSENSFTTDDLMALINFDVTKTLFRPPNILTDQPFFRPPRTLRRLITTKDLVSKPF